MIEQILGPITPFLDRLFEHLQEDEIEVSQFELDHICYRVETLQRYQELVQQLSPLGDLLTETMIGGRPISTFKLLTPIEYQDRTIYCLELPAPKVGSPYLEGFEHAEFVIDVPFAEFMNKYSKCKFKMKGMQKVVNPEISRKYDGISVKFHHHPIEYVIKYLD